MTKCLFKTWVSFIIYWFKFYNRILKNWLFCTYHLIRIFLSSN